MGNKIKSGILEKNGTEYPIPVEYEVQADDVPFDDTNVEITADTTQIAIEELDNKVLTSASPGYSWGRSGNSPRRSWLKNEGVPSNIAGRFVYIYNAKITKLFVSNENIDTYDISVYHHEGDGTNLTLVGSVSVVNARGASFDVAFPIPTGTQIALRITNGSAKNIVAGAELEGTKNA